MACFNVGREVVVEDRPRVPHTDHLVLERGPAVSPRTAFTLRLYLREPSVSGRRKVVYPPSSQEIVNFVLVQF